jgi:hypothetical protein
MDQVTHLDDTMSSNTSSNKGGETTRHSNAPRIGTKLPNQPERVREMQTGCDEMSTIMAKMKVNRALRKSVPPSADTLYFSGEHILVFRENKKGFNGPFQISHVLGITVYVLISGGSVKPFSRA